MRNYSKLKITQIVIEPANGILTGSITNIKIDVDKVEVEEFKPGFSDENGNDFNELTFD